MKGIIFIISLLLLNINFNSVGNEKTCTGSNEGAQLFQSDITSPFIINVMPSDAQKDISILSQIKIEFNELMNITATESSFSIEPNINGTFHWDTNTLIFTPQMNLSINTSFNVRIDSSQAKDIAGNLLDGNKNGIHDAPNSWLARANIPTARTASAGAVLNNRIYIMGGAISSGPSKKVEIFDPINNSWSTGTDMSFARSGLSAGVINDKIYVVGGYNYTASLEYNTIEEYNPQTAMWTQKAPMSVARRGVCVCVVNDKLYAIGGKSGGSFLKLVEEYNPFNNTWVTKTPMQYFDGYCGAAVVNDKIFVTGGFSPQTQEYDPITDTWRIRQPPITERISFAASAFGGKIYGIGGSTWSGTPLASNNEYNPATNSWSTKTNMPTARWDLVVLTFNNAIYAISGGSLTGGMFPSSKWNFENEMYIINDDYVWTFVTSETPDKTFRIAIHSGWNLISIPLKMTETSIPNMLVSIKDRWDVIKYYDTTDAKDPWKTYRNGSSINDLAHIDEKMGIWLHATMDCNLTIFGKLPVDTNITLVAGWNLIGYPTLNENITLGNAFWGTGADRAAVFDNVTPYVREIGPTYIMKPGEGYWIHVPADSVWTINW